jgi:hypothetical protein
VDRVHFQPTNLGVYTYAQTKPRFRRRQFGDQPTRAQFRFDVGFGLVAPVLCFLFDPVVFHAWMSRSGGLYGRLQFFTYAASAIEIATLACWLFVVAKYPAWSRPAGGVMVAGAVLSFALGLAILPFSVIGLIAAGLGALGFIPFLTGLVYLRNGLRAMRLNRAGAPVRGGAAVSVAFGLALAFGLPAAAHVCARRAVESSVARVVAGEELSRPRARVMRALSFVSMSSFEGVVSRYRNERDPERKARMAEAYEGLTGRDINRHYNQWID